MNLKGNCWPTPEQLLLLKAGLLPEPFAQMAWQTYCETVDIDKIAGASFHLLPLVYRNLNKNNGNGNDKNLKLAKGVYRYHWAANQLHFQSLKTVLLSFQQQAIDVCLLKGAALILTSYQDKGMRVIGDVDILVPITQAWLAIQSLLAQHWQPLLEEGVVLTEDFISTHHALFFKNAKNEKLDLHWYLCPDAITDSAVASLTFKKQFFHEPSLGFMVETLCAEDQLLHILLHGIRHSPQALISWVADAVILLRETLHFAWDYFLHQVKRARSELLVYSALRYLQQQGFIVLPEQIAQHCLAYKPQPFEQRYVHFITQAHCMAFVPIQIVWYRHVRHSLPRHYCSALGTFPAFLKKAWGLNMNRQLFYLAWKKLWQHWRVTQRA